MVLFGELEILSLDFLLACALLDAESIIVTTVIMPHFDKKGSLSEFLS
jgi:hypothetical protein